MELRELARKLKALGHPIRLRILAYLLSNGDSYLSEVAAAIGVSRALAKVHLKVLEGAGFVKSRVERREGVIRPVRVYSAEKFKLEVSSDMLAELWRRERGKSIEGDRPNSAR